MRGSHGVEVVGRKVKISLNDARAQRRIALGCAFAPLREAFFFLSRVPHSSLYKLVETRHFGLAGLVYNAEIWSLGTEQSSVLAKRLFNLANCLAVLE